MVGRSVGFRLVRAVELPVALGLLRMGRPVLGPLVALGLELDMGLAAILELGPGVGLGTLMGLGAFVGLGSRLVARRTGIPPAALGRRRARPVSWQAGYLG